MPHAPTPTAAREVELKLLVQPEDLKRILALPFLRSMADGEPVVHHLSTVYYDTPDLELAADSVALRLRRDGDRFVQTVKTLADDAPGDSAGVAVRREWDWPVPGDSPDLSLLDRSGAGALIPKALRDRLVPIFTTRFDRTVLIVRPDARTKVEVAVDEGEVVAGDRSERISELELELKDGRMGRLFHLALGVLRHVPVRIATENKAEIGYRLVTGRIPGPAAEEPVALSPMTTVAEAFRHIVRQGIRQTLENEACALQGGDAEGLHRIRIALRRLRLALRLFRPVLPGPEAEEFRRELRWAYDGLGLARDWDVLCGPVLSALATEAAPSNGDALAAAASVARRVPMARAADSLRSVRFSRLILGLGAWLEDGRWHAEAEGAVRADLDRPMSELAAPWLDDLALRVRRTVRGYETGGVVDEEKLRTRLRRLGTAAALFRGLYAPGGARPYLAIIEPLQTALDGLHDMATAEELLDHLAEVVPIEGAKRRLGERRRLSRRTLPGLWAALGAAAPFWR